VLLVALAFAIAASACGGAPTPPPSYPAGSIVVTARNRQFDTAEIKVPANVPFTIVLVNQDGDSHNISIRTRQGFDGQLIFRHDPISASTIVLSVGPIPAGTYYFMCEIHPSMTGTVFAY
jgi:plastocyanin